MDIINSIYIYIYQKIEFLISEILIIDIRNSNYWNQLMNFGYQKLN